MSDQQQHTSMKVADLPSERISPAAIAVLLQIAPAVRVGMTRWLAPGEAVGKPQEPAGGDRAATDGKWPADRLPAGALVGLVLAFLREREGDGPHGPGQIGKRREKLGRGRQCPGALRARREGARGQRAAGAVHGCGGLSMRRGGGSARDLCDAHCHALHPPTDEEICRSPSEDR
jgi:hypothetical protein